MSKRFWGVFAVFLVIAGTAKADRRGTDAQREAIIREISVWWWRGPVTAANMDEQVCGYRRSSLERLQVIHDAYKPYVQGGIIPLNARANAQSAAVQAGMAYSHYADMDLSEESASDDAACCRDIARGDRISGPLRKECPGTAPEQPTIRDFGPVPWHRPN